jgi:glutamine amidotransferase
MCLAIYKPAETPVDWKSYENGFDSNDHSWGFAAVQDGKLVVKHGVGKFDEFRHALEPYAQCQAVIHFRWATHGSRTVANCHPFLVSRDLAVIHNGIISIKCNVHSDRSDTWHFNELVLKPMHKHDPDFFTRPEMIYTQEQAHRGNKLCFLRADGEYAIWNEEDGHWTNDGHWYSNTDYESSRYARWYDYGRSGSKASNPIGYLGASGARYLPVEDKEEEPVMDTKTIEFDLDADAGDLLAERQAGVTTIDEEGTLIRDPYSGDLAYEGDKRTMDEADEYEQQYTDIRWNELRMYGLTEQCLTEVFELLGHFGIEALHDAM